MILKCEILEPDADSFLDLTEEMVGFILRFGAPKEIRVTNEIIGAVLEQLCHTCGIKLRKVKRLQALEKFKQGMGWF